MNTRITLSTAEIAILEAIDGQQLSSCVDDCIACRSISGLSAFKLTDLGPYVYRHWVNFSGDIDALYKAKAARKVAETQARASASGQRLRYAVQELQQLAEKQIVNAQLFKVDDMPLPPFSYSTHLSVRIGYAWRLTADSDWQRGVVEFVATVDDEDGARQYGSSRLARTKAEKARYRQANLAESWRAFAVYTVRAVYDFLEHGGDGSLIPAKQEVDWRGLRYRSLDGWLVSGQ